MKIVIASALAIIVLTGWAVDVAAQNSYTQFGNTVYGSDGSIYNQFGDTVYDNKGNSWTQFGDTTYGSDGSKCTQFGNTLYCN